MILRDLRRQIENVINQSNLSIDAVYFVLKDILNEVTDIYNQEIQKEQQLLDSELQISESNNVNIEKKEE